MNKDLYQQVDSLESFLKIAEKKATENCQNFGKNYVLVLVDQNEKYVKGAMIGTNMQMEMFQLEENAEIQAEEK